MLGGGTRLLLDSSIWIAILRQGNTWPLERSRQLFATNNVLLADLCYVEVVRGATNAKQVALLKNRLAGFEMVNVCTPALVVRAVDLHQELRSKGVTVRGTIDLLIGTWCVENDVALLHDDRDFAGFEKYLGLKVWRGEWA